MLSDHLFYLWQSQKHVLDVKQKAVPQGTCKHRQGKYNAGSDFGA